MIVHARGSGQRVYCALYSTSQKKRTVTTMYKHLTTLQRGVVQVVYNMDVYSYVDISVHVSTLHYNLQSNTIVTTLHSTIYNIRTMVLHNLHIRV